MADVTLITALSGALTPVLAVAGAYIAWQNMRIARHKIKVDLFEKRLRVFNNLDVFLDSLLDLSSLPVAADPYLAYLDVFKEAQWLFSEEVTRWIDAQIGMKAVRHILALEEMQGADEEARVGIHSAFVENRAALVTAKHGMRDIFSPYLLLDHTKKKTARSTLEKPRNIRSRTR